MSGARERMAKEMMQRGSGESHQRQRRNQKDSNDIFALTNTDELQLTGFDCSDYNIGRNQFPDEDEEQQQQEQEPDFADSNEDLLDHGGEDSNDLGVFDLATLCLVDVDAEDGPDLHLCKDISKAKGQIIPYEYRVYLSKTIDDDGNKEQGSSPVAVASKAGPSAGSFNAETSRIDIVRDVERRMMAHVASKMGLADCDSSTSTPAPANRALRRRSLDNSGVKFIDSAGLRQLVEDSQSPLIGISSDPVDGISGEPLWNKWILRRHAPIIPIWGFSSNVCFANLFLALLYHKYIRIRLSREFSKPALPLHVRERTSCSIFRCDHGRRSHVELRQRYREPDQCWYGYRYFCR